MPIGIVLAPYGTLFPSALATYDQIQKTYEREFPGSPVRLAFTSHLMRKRLQENEGISVLSLPAALAELHDLGSESVVVQSLQIVPGGEFHQVAALVQGLKGSESRPSRAWRSACLCSRTCRTAEGSHPSCPPFAAGPHIAGTRRKRRCFWWATARATLPMLSTL